MDPNISPVSSDGLKIALEKWLMDRVTDCDRMIEGSSSPSLLKSRSDAFREALEKLWEISPVSTPVCRVCGAEMGRSRSGRLTCSVKCRVAAHRLDALASERGNGQSAGLRQ